MNGPECIAELRIISQDPGYAITIIQSPASGEAGELHVELVTAIARRGPDGVAKYHHFFFGRITTY